MSGEGPESRKAKQALASAEKKLAGCRTKATDARDDFEEARKDLKDLIKERVKKGDPQWRRLQNAEQKATRKLKKLTKKYGPEHQETESARQEFTEAVKSREARENELWRQTNVEQIGARTPVERTVYTITLDGVSMAAEDHVESYATTTKAGTDIRVPGDSRELVDQAIDKADLSDSAKKVLKGVSHNESTLAGMNLYDKKRVTWGFIQWAGGEQGSSLSQALSTIKKTEPEAFKRRFREYGIDVGKQGLKVTQPDGTVLEGDDAAKAIQGDPVLTGVMARAGMDPEIQEGQIEAARRTLKGLLDDKIQVTAADGQKTAIRLGDVMTSEYGVGILMDIGVHYGQGEARWLIRQTVQDMAASGQDPAKIGEWSAATEAEVIKGVTEKDSRRPAAIKNQGADQKPGSFKP